MLASQLGGYGAQTGSCALPHDSLGASPNLAMFPGICWMYSTGSPPTEDFVPYNFLNLAVPPWSCSRISSRLLPHYHGNSGSSLSHLNRAGSSSPICPHCNYAESRLLSCWSLALEWAIFGDPIVP